MTEPLTPAELDWLRDEAADNYEPTAYIPRLIATIDALAPTPEPSAEADAVRPMAIAEAWQAGYDFARAEAPDPSAEACPYPGCESCPPETSAETDAVLLAGVVSDVLAWATEQDSTYGYSDEPGSPYVQLITDGLLRRGVALSRPATPPLDVLTADEWADVIDVYGSFGSRLVAARLAAALANPDPDAA